MFRYFLSWSLISSVVLIFFTLQVEAASSNVNKVGLALEGHDPVSYFKQDAIIKGPIKGDPKIQVKYENITYQFFSEANKQEFLQNPPKFVPAFGGWCAYAIAENKEKVEVDTKSFLIQDGRLLLFYNGFLADTRKKWQSSKSKTSSQFLKEADSNWVEVKNKDL